MIASHKVALASPSSPAANSAIVTCSIRTAPCRAINVPDTAEAAAPAR